MGKLNAYDRPRGSGKTEIVKRRMYQNQSWVCIVPNEHMRKLYPEDLQSRIFTHAAYTSGHMNVRQKSARAGTSIDTVIIDEGILMDPITLAQLYYSLGKDGWIVEMYCTNTKPSFDKDGHPSVSDIIDSISDTFDPYLKKKLDEYMLEQLEKFTYQARRGRV